MVESNGEGAALAIAALAASAAVARPAASARPALDEPAFKSDATSVLEDRPQLLVPKHALTEEENDRRDAQRLFAAGCLAERREEFPEALRSYQRALRLDPSAATVAQSIVPLAFRLKQPEVAVRYALKAAELGGADAGLLLKLGAYLTELGDWKTAATIYQKVLAAAQDDSDPAARFILRLELGRVYHLLGEHKKAAEQFAVVLEALKNPQKYELTADGVERLTKEPALTYRLFGESFLHAGRYAEAAAAFQKADALKPDQPLFRFQQARVKARTGQPQQALADLQVYFDKKQSGEGDAPYELLGEILTAGQEVRRVAAAAGEAAPGRSAERAAGLRPGRPVPPPGPPGSGRGAVR